jgi:hypothetical protein
MLASKQQRHVRVGLVVKKKARPGICKLPGELLLGKPGIQRDEDAAELGEGVDSQHEL